ncbi:MAG: spiro-SPASM protein [Treponema sp.]|nr:spiro-SPASM protein [Treponema sp.]
MKALSVLYHGRPGVDKAASAAANADSLAAVTRFPGTEKIVFLGQEGASHPPLPPGAELICRPAWTRKSLMESLSVVSAGYDFLYFAWADCPLLDPALAAALAERHTRYGAEYSYADGWPYGFAPELLNPQTAGILAKFAEDDESRVERDAIFQLIQKDINAFDIETEISTVDLRPYRLSLTADSRRNRLLLSRFSENGLTSAADAEKLLSERPEAVAKTAMLRTLPAFFNIQVTGACPQTCSLCPWPAYSSRPVTECSEHMAAADFEKLLDKIVEFAGDAVIDLSLWGEPAMHPQKIELVEMVLRRPGLSLIIETSGIGWKEEELKALAASASSAKPRENGMAALSWVVSLDAHDPERYKELRGSGFSEAKSTAKTLFSLFPKDTYVQAVRVKDSEDDIEQFYRYWKAEQPERAGASHVIIQKYDDFAGNLPKRQATDLSPVKRRPCWHIMRDMNILLDGSVPSCREDLGALKGEPAAGLWGNAFSDNLADIWERGSALYLEHCKAEYRGICALCDEYYTYNF